MGKHFASIAVATAVLALILSAIRPPRSALSTAGLWKHAHYAQLPLTFEPNQVKRIHASNLFRAATPVRSF
jgi:hypothetical protein